MTSPALRLLEDILERAAAALPEDLMQEAQSLVLGDKRTAKAPKDLKVPLTPQAYDAAANEAIKNLFYSKPAYRSAYSLSQQAARSSMPPRTSSSYLDDGTPAKSAGETAFALMPIRDMLRVVSDAVAGDNGCKGKSGSALGKLNTILDHGRHVSPDYDVKPGPYATTPEDEKRIRESNIAKTGGRR